MSIDLDTEDVLSLAKAARLLPAVRGSKPPHPTTLVRWATVGIKSVSGRTVTLETVFIGGTRMTSKQALARFIARRNDAEFKPMTESAERERTYLEKQAAEAMQRMRAAGLIGP
jgi:hypothetical protein